MEELSTVFVSLSAFVFILLPLYPSTWVRALFIPMIPFAGSMLLAAYITATKDKFQIFTKVFGLMGYFLVLLAAMFLLLDFQFFYIIWAVFVVILGFSFDTLLVRMYIYGTWGRATKKFS